MTAALVLAAAATLESEQAADPERWRDQAVLLAARNAWAAGDLVAVRALAASYDALLVQVPARTSAGLVLRSAGNAERRNRGAFSTPPTYAASLAERALPLPVRAGGAGLSVVDPACGAGALLRAALARLLAGGVPPARAAAALHGVDNDPVAVELCRSALAADLTEAGIAYWPDDFGGRIVTGDALLGATPDRPAAGPGVTWHELFPAVLARSGAPAEPVTGWRGGFDAVIANPPWERLKVHARDWAGAPPEGLRGDRADLTQALRAAGRHPLTGAGELNAYLPFVETCWRLLAPGGRAAVLVPSGIASDRSAARLLSTLIETGSLARMHLFEPAAAIFSGVSTRIGVAVLELTGQGVPGPKRVAEVAVGLAGPGDAPGERAWPLEAGLLRVLNPNTGTAPLFGSGTDARIVTAIHRHTPVLLRRRGPAAPEVLADGWAVRLVTPLHMTRDAPSFRTAPGEGLVPLWEAKHCGLLDPHGGSVARPRYWVPEELMRERHPGLWSRGWLAGYRNVATTDSPRTLLPTPIPLVAVGNSLPLISAPRLPLLLAALASLPVDYLLRQKHAGANVNFFKLEQVPVPSPDRYDQPCPWAEGSVADWVLARFAAAVVWVPGLAALAAELRAAGVPVKDANPASKAQIWTARAELDAAHAVLLGLDRADLAHVLSTFTALRRREQRELGRFATAERVLAAYDRIEGGRVGRREPPVSASG